MGFGVINKKIMKNKLSGLLKWGGMIGVALSPVMAFAQVQATCVQGSTVAGAGPGTIEFFLCRVSLILNTIVPILITLGVVYFIYGVISYAIAKDDEASNLRRIRVISCL